jgi:serine/threonine protein kinase
MVSGYPPFTGSTLDDLLNSIVNGEPPPLLELASELPPDLDRVLRRALSKQRSFRFNSITAFMRALEGAVEIAG